MASEQEKVAVEEKVPLQSDTDAPATETPAADVPATEQKTDEPVAKKSWWFGRKGKKPAATAEEQPAAEDDVEKEKTEGDAEEKPKKKCFFSFCSKAKKTEEEQKEDHISIGINLVDRDEKGNQNNIQFAFEDIFGEADSAHSFDCAWRATSSTFNFVRTNVYKLVALPFQIIFAIIFGIFFGLIAAINSFVIIPSGKLLSVVGSWFAKVWDWLIHAIFDPITSSLGLAFSRMSVRSYGINNQPTDPCIA